MDADLPSVKLGLEVKTEKILAIWLQCQLCGSFLPEEKLPFHVSTSHPVKKVEKKCDLKISPENYDKLKDFKKESKVAAQESFSTSPTKRVTRGSLQKLIRTQPKREAKSKHFLNQKIGDNDKSSSKRVRTGSKTPSGSESKNKVTEIQTETRLFVYPEKVKVVRHEFSLRVQRGFRRKPLRWNSPKNFVCKYKYCNAAFRSRFQLDIHMRIHSNERPFQCRFGDCTKAFSQLTILENHMRTHTKEKPFKCHSCNKCFSQVTNLVMHKRIHTGVKPYECKICGKKFAQVANWGQHMKNIHK